MNRLLVLSAAVAAFVLPGNALAAECTTTGVPSARVIPIPTGDFNSDMMLGLALSVRMVAAGRSVDRATPCTRGSAIEVGRQRYTLTGENTDEAPRRAVPARRNGPAFYLTRIEDGRATAAAQAAGNPTPPAPAEAFALVRVEGSNAAAARLYTAIPDDATLRAAIIEFSSGVPRTLARVQNGRVQLTVAPPAATPAPGAGAPGATGRILEADGSVFVPAEDGGVRHQVTGFVCPAQIAGVSRRDMIIYDNANGGRDVSCGYGEIGSAGWHTLYLTRLPGMDHRSTFETYVRDAKRNAPPERDIASPLAGGPAPLPTSTAFWVDVGGGVQGLWLATIGDWQIKVRTTMRPGGEQGAAAFARDAFAQAYAAVPATPSTPSPPTPASPGPVAALANDQG